MSPPCKFRHPMYSLQICLRPATGVITSAFIARTIGTTPLPPQTQRLYYAGPTSNGHEAAQSCASSSHDLLTGDPVSFPLGLEQQLCVQSSILCESPYFRCDKSTLLAGLLEFEGTFAWDLDSFGMGCRDSVSHHNFAFAFAYIYQP